MSAVVLEDGTISIPQEVREALGLGPGTVLEVQTQAGTLVAWKKGRAGCVREVARSRPASRRDQYR